MSESHEPNPRADASRAQPIFLFSPLASGHLQLAYARAAQMLVSRDFDSRIQRPLKTLQRIDGRREFDS